MNQNLLLKLSYAHFSTRDIYKLLLQFHLSLDDELEIHNFFGDAPEDIPFQWKKKYQRFQTINIDHIRRNLELDHIHVLSIEDQLYPENLREIYDAPLLLFVKGNLDCLKGLSQRGLSIVGSRNATEYTRRALDVICPEFKTLNLVIVSGLAKGADACAHEMALKHQLNTVGVLGFGHQMHYPKETLDMRHWIETYHCTISEYPPFTKIAKFRFPERNRIISGVSNGVLVTEANQQSGALITIDQALDQNRNVYVLPGSMFNDLTKGNMKRAKEGAKIVTEASDILEDYLTIS
ncbi:DNA-processing protein DprA [Staphylococcus massiliensis]|uniref:DNA-processing protein DprA n=1 Tax=Staphylococcus massiliensis TaxID=555791 RepID=UPI001EDCA78C|nr:DNA-processing protein DprA [Staphylococcus massiliensis]MCG3398763.1 DNA-processing protein DprA [Staphylococcus massiliensis]